ncbi:hypothetical protein K2173_028426 [Erythroxylum novogranatense]|uniref:B-like cyclin n=1 Tax=Erythroxylum novogranatense TaxID=1862640 RepID=A0AAV8U560_9ROSI|nr:hypothetical protein K2173_028426 [Erythroxylum novogranatense]
MEGESVQGLLCQETDTCCLDEGAGDHEIAFMDLPQNGDYSNREGDLEMLIERETSLGFKVNQSGVFQNWVKCARLEAIEWILKSRATFGFRLQTAYLSMLYLDRFLSRRSIDGEKLWAVRLLSVACLSLAAKMEEMKIPSLSEFQIDDYNFETKLIQRMELLVLSTLEWKMISVTPFSFLHYFIVKCCKDESPSMLMLRRTVGLILNLMREINLIDHRPSAIAIAATLAALDQGLTRVELECKMNSILCSHFLEIEDVFKCYALIQRLATENLNLPRSVSSVDILPTQLKPTDVSGSSSITSATSVKRKGLASENPDQSYKSHEKRLR